MENGNAFTSIFDVVAALAFAAFALAGLLGLLAQKLRFACSLVLHVASIGIGLDVWVWSLVTVHQLWGTVAMAIGLVFAGIGVVPMALVATTMNDEWVLLGYLILMSLIFFACRAAAVAMFDKSERKLKRSETA